MTYWLAYQRRRKNWPVILQKHLTFETAFRLYKILLFPPSNTRQIIPTWALLAEEHPTAFLITLTHGELPTETDDLELFIITHELSSIKHALTSP